MKTPRGGRDAPIWHSLARYCLTRLFLTTSLLSLVLILGSAQPSSAQALPEKRSAADVGGLPENEILLSADEVIYEDTLGIITAKGNVELIREGSVLRADLVSYNRRADIVTATGNVALLEPSGDVIFSNHVELSGDLKSGAIKGLRVLLTDKSRLAANGGRMTSDGRTEMTKAVYSPCPLCADDPEKAPLWQIKAYSITHDRTLKQIYYKDLFFEVYGVPVIYLPFFSHADPTVKRKTGLLQPSFGNNTALGAIYKQPYFFNISESSDLTIAPMFLSRQDPVLTAEYRQVTDTGAFTIEGSGTTDRRPPEDGQETKRVRGHIDASGKFDLSENWQYGFNVRRSTDETYLARYRFSRGRKALQSRAYIEGSNNRTFADLSAYSFQTLDPFLDSDTVPWVLPVGTYKYRGEPGKIGGYWLFDADTRVLGRTKGASSEMAAFKAGWRLPYTGPLGDRLELTTSLRSDLYHVNNVSDPNNPSQASRDGFAARLIPTADLEWRYPWVRGGETMSQVIEPIVQIVARPNGGNDTKIPNEDSLAFEFSDSNLFTENRFSGLDRIEGGVRANYGVRLSVVGNKGGEAEFLIGQTYRLRRDNTFERGTGLSENFSDYVGRVRINPGPYLAMDYRFRIDSKAFTIRRSSLSLTGGPSWLRGTVSYSNLRAEPTTGVPSVAEQINLSAFLRLSDNWFLNARHLRDLSANGGPLLSGASVTYVNQCFWGRFSITQDSTRQLDNVSGTSFLFEVQLTNLG